MKTPTERFSNRVENYAKYRPRYPDAALQLLCGIVPPPAVVADIGSGTGIFTKQLLNAGFEVYAIEPNDAMRGEAERSLKSEPLFRSVKGTAESTSLPDHFADLITSAQAFHWFDRVKAKAEFRRILRPGKWAALIWNERQADASRLGWKYEELLRLEAPEYSEANHRNVGSEDVRAFFEPGGGDCEAILQCARAWPGSLYRKAVIYLLCASHGRAGTPRHRCCRRAVV